jgi:hypothetical protein
MRNFDAVGKPGIVSRASAVCPNGKVFQKRMEFSREGRIAAQLAFVQLGPEYAASREVRWLEV